MKNSSQNTGNSKNLMVPKSAFSKSMLTILFFIVISSCKENCGVTFFEVLEIGLNPQTLQTTGGWGPWDDENELGIDRLLLSMEMPKNYSLIENPECPNTLRNSNPAVEFKLISNKDFSPEYPAGSDLTAIMDFSFFLQDFTKEEFINNHFNGSGWPHFHLTFNKNTAAQALHSFILIAQLEDGSIMESTPVDVLLIPF